MGVSKSKDAQTEAQRVFRLKKTAYHPIEAAIRWSGHFEQEQCIIQSIKLYTSDTNCYKKMLDRLKNWHPIYLNAERIYDGIIHSELSCSRNGIKIKKPSSSIDDPELTVRHVELKKWMSTYYPEEKPDFLFSPIEQKMISVISTDCISALLTDRETLKVQLEIVTDKATLLENELKNHQLVKDNSQCIHKRAENTYLSLIGALLWVLLGSSPSGKPYSAFTNLEAIIHLLLIQFKGCPGLSESNLRTKFATAKKILEHHLKNT